MDTDRKDKIIERYKKLFLVTFGQLQFIEAMLREIIHLSFENNPQLFIGKNKERLSLNDLKEKSFGQLIAILRKLKYDSGFINTVDKIRNIRNFLAHEGTLLIYMKHKYNLDLYESAINFIETNAVYANPL